MAVLALTVARPGDRATVTGPTLRWQVAGEGHGTPAVDAAGAYFLTGRQEIVAVDRRTGGVRWRAALTPGRDAVTGSRVVAAADVVVAGGHDLIALDRTTGGRRWTWAPADEYGFGFYLGEPEGDTLYAGSASGMLRAFEAESGQPRWGIRVGGEETTVYTPAVDDSLVAATFTDFSQPGRRGLVAVDRQTGVERWRRLLPAARDGMNRPAAAGGPVFDEDNIIVATQDGVIHAFGRDAGAEVWLWPDDGSSGPDFRPLARAGALLVAGSLSGEVLALHSRSGRLLWRTRPSEASVAFGIVATSEVIYVPYVSGVLVALEAADGRERWRTPGAGGWRWAPRIAGGWLFAAGSEAGFMAWADAASEKEE